MTAQPSAPIWRDNGPHYGRLSRLLHWSFALTFIISAGLGLWGANTENVPLLIVLLSVHKSLGVALLTLWLLRLAWRLKQGWPDPIIDSAVNRLAAKLAHWLLLALIPMAVLSGWAYSNASAFPVSFFGLFELPTLLPADKFLAERLQQLHHLIVFSLLTLVALHIIAAVYHHRYLRDDTLRRMLRR